MKENQNKRTTQMQAQKEKIGTKKNQNHQGAVAANEYMESRNEKGDAARMQVPDCQTLIQTFK